MKPLKDLSKGGPIDYSEVQDFSLSKKSSNSSQSGVSFLSGKGKLDDMLTKLMKKNNYVSKRFVSKYLWKFGFSPRISYHFYCFFF